MCPIKDDRRLYNLDEKVRVKELERIGKITRIDAAYTHDLYVVTFPDRDTAIVQGKEIEPLSNVEDFILESNK